MTLLTESLMKRRSVEMIVWLREFWMEKKAEERGRGRF